MGEEAARHQLKDLKTRLQCEKTINSKLMSDQDTLRKKLAEAELHIDQLRLESKVNVSQQFSVSHETRQCITLQQKTEARDSWSVPPLVSSAEGKGRKGLDPAVDLGWNTLEDIHLMEKGSGDSRSDQQGQTSPCTSEDSNLISDGSCGNIMEEGGRQIQKNYSSVSSDSVSTINGGSRSRPPSSDISREESLPVSVSQVGEMESAATMTDDHISAALLSSQENLHTFARKEPHISRLPLLSPSAHSSRNRCTPENEIESSPASSQSDHSFFLLSSITPPDLVSPGASLTTSVSPSPIPLDPLDPALDPLAMCKALLLSHTLGQKAEIEGLFLSQLFRIHSLLEQVASLKKKTYEDGCTVDELCDGLGDILLAHKKLQSDIEKELLLLGDSQVTVDNRDALDDGLVALEENLKELDQILRNKTAHLMNFKNQEKSATMTTRSAEDVLVPDNEEAGKSLDREVSNYSSVSGNSNSALSKYLPDLESSHGSMNELAADSQSVLSDLEELCLAETLQEWAESAGGRYDTSYIKPRGHTANLQSAPHSKASEDIRQSVPHEKNSLGGISFCERARGTGENGVLVEISFQGSDRQGDNRDKGMSSQERPSGSNGVHSGVRDGGDSGVVGGGDSGVVGGGDSGVVGGGDSGVVGGGDSGVVGGGDSGVVGGGDSGVVGDGGSGVRDSGGEGGGGGRSKGQWGKLDKHGVQNERQMLKGKTTYRSRIPRLIRRTSSLPQRHPKPQPHRTGAVNGDMIPKPQPHRTGAVNGDMIPKPQPHRTGAVNGDMVPKPPSTWTTVVNSNPPPKLECGKSLVLSLPPAVSDLLHVSHTKQLPAPLLPDTSTLTQPHTSSQLSHHLELSSPGAARVSHDTRFHSSDSKKGLLLHESVDGGCGNASFACSQDASTDRMPLSAPPVESQRYLHDIPSPTSQLSMKDESERQKDLKNLPLLLAVFQEERMPLSAPPLGDHPRIPVLTSDIIPEDQATSSSAQLSSAFRKGDFSRRPLQLTGHVTRAYMDALRKDLERLKEQVMKSSQSREEMAPQYHSTPIISPSPLSASNHFPDCPSSHVPSSHVPSSPVPSSSRGLGIPSSPVPSSSRGLGIPSSPVPLSSRGLGIPSSPVPSSSHGLGIPSSPVPSSSHGLASFVSASSVSSLSDMPQSYCNSSATASLPTAIHFSSHRSCDLNQMRSELSTGVESPPHTETTPTTIASAGSIRSTERHRSDSSIQPHHYHPTSHVPVQSQDHRQSSVLRDVHEQLSWLTQKYNQLSLSQNHLSSSQKLPPSQNHRRPLSAGQLNYGLSKSARNQSLFKSESRPSSWSSPSTQEGVLQPSGTIQVLPILPDSHIQHAWLSEAPAQHSGHNCPHRHTTSIQSTPRRRSRPRITSSNTTIVQSEENLQSRFSSAPILAHSTPLWSNNLLVTPPRTRPRGGSDIDNSSVQSSPLVRTAAVSTPVASIAPSLTPSHFTPSKFTSGSTDLLSPESDVHTPSLSLDSIHTPLRSPTISELNTPPWMDHALSLDNYLAQPSPLSSVSVSAPAFHSQANHALSSSLNTTLPDNTISSWHGSTENALVSQEHSSLGIMDNSHLAQKHTSSVKSHDPHMIVYNEKDEAACEHPSILHNSTMRLEDSGVGNTSCSRYSSSTSPGKLDAEYDTLQQLPPDAAQVVASSVRSSPDDDVFLVTNKGKKEDSAARGDASHCNSQHKQDKFHTSSASKFGRDRRQQLGSIDRQQSSNVGCSLSDEVSPAAEDSNKHIASTIADSKLIRPELPSQYHRDGSGDVMYSKDTASPSDPVRYTWYSSTHDSSKSHHSSCRHRTPPRLSHSSQSQRPPADHHHSTNTTNLNSGSHSFSSNFDPASHSHLSDTPGHSWSARRLSSRRHRSKASSPSVSVSHKSPDSSAHLERASQDPNFYGHHKKKYKEVITSHRYPDGVDSTRSDDARSFSSDSHYHSKVSPSRFRLDTQTEHMKPKMVSTGTQFSPPSVSYPSRVSHMHWASRSPTPPSDDGHNAYLPLHHKKSAHRQHKLKTVYHSTGSEDSQSSTDTTHHSLRSLPPHPTLPSSTRHTRTSLSPSIALGGHGTSYGTDPLLLVNINRKVREGERRRARLEDGDSGGIREYRSPPSRHIEDYQERERKHMEFLGNGDDAGNGSGSGVVDLGPSMEIARQMRRKSERMQETIAREMKRYGFHHDTPLGHSPPPPPTHFGHYY